MDAAPTPLADKGLASEQLVERLGEIFCVESYGSEIIRDDLRSRQPSYWSTICPDVRESYRRGIRAILAALSAQPAGDATDGEGVADAQVDAWIEDIAPACVDCSNAVQKARRGAMRRLWERIKRARTHPPKPEAIAGEGVLERAKQIADMPTERIIKLLRSHGEYESYQATAWRRSNGDLFLGAAEALSRTSQANEGEIERLLQDIRHWISQAHYNAIGAPNLLTRLDQALSPSPDAEGAE